MKTPADDRRWLATRLHLREGGPTLLAAALLLAALAWVGMRSIDAAIPVPMGDESLHLTRVLDLEALLRRTHGAWNRAILWVFSGDAYPNGLYSTSLAFVMRDHTLAGARTTLVAFGLAHAAAAIWLGRRMWGPGAWAYALLVFASPVALVYLRVYLLDVPLLAAVGVAVLSVEASDGFRRPGATFCFVVAAVIGLYVKWTWALFCAVPIVIAALHAVWAAPTWRWRAAWGLGLPVLAGGLAWLVVSAGRTWGERQTAQAFDIVVVGVAWVALWASVTAITTWRGRPLPGRWNLAAVTVGIAAVAGPWYALVWGSLWGRYAHEQRMYAERAATNLDAGIDTVRLLLPAGEVLLVVGVLVAVVGRRGGWTLAGRVAGGALAAAVIIQGLPADPRYLLPLIGLGAGAVVAGWGAFPRAAWGLASGVAALVVATGVGPLFGWNPLDLHATRRGDPPAMPITVKAVGSTPVGVLSASPSPATPEEIAGLIAAIRRSCPGKCVFGWTTLGAGGRRITGREIQALGRWARVDIEVFDVDASGALPGGRTAHAMGRTVCPPETEIRPENGAAGWVDGTWRSGPQSGGCRITLRPRAAE